MVRWNWLATIISGRSHIDSISRGVDRESEKYVKDIFRLLSLNWFNSGRPRSVIMKLWAVVLIQTKLFLDSQVSGTSMAVGKIIFSIVEDLSFGRGQHHMCWIP